MLEPPSARLAADAGFEPGGGRLADAPRAGSRAAPVPAAAWAAPATAAVPPPIPSADAPLLPLDLPFDAGAPAGAEARALARIEFAAWEAAAASRGADLGSYVFWEEWDRAQLSLGLSDEPVSDWFVEAYHPFYAGVGGQDVGELRGAITKALPVLQDALARLAAFGGARRRRRAASATGAARAWGRADLAALMPGGIAPPETWLDEDWSDEEEEDAPGAVPAPVIARVHAIRHAGLRSSAALEVAIHAVRHPLADLGSLACDYERIDDAAAEHGFDPFDPKGLGEFVQRYGIDREWGVDDLPHAVLSVMKRVFASRAALGVYAERFAEVSDEVLSVRLPEPAGAIARSKEIARIARAADREGLAARKERSDAIDVDLMLVVMRNRARQARRMEARFMAASARMRELRLTGVYRFSYVERVVRPSGRLSPRRQRVYMSVWTGPALARLGEGGLEDLVDPNVDPATVDHHLVWDGVEPEAAGSPLDIRCHEPWFVEHFRVGVHLPPKSLPAELRDRRRAVVLRDGLPSTAHRPSGLFGPRGDAERALTVGALLAGLVVIPVGGYALAVTMGYAIGRGLVFSFARVGEVLQVTCDANAFTGVETDLGVLPAFWAVAKLHAERSRFPVDDAVMGLFAMVKRGRRRLEGGLAPSAPSRALARKAPGDALHLFASGGRQFGPGEVNFVFRHLMAGVRRMRSHDIRHATAGCAHEEGVSLRDLASLLRYMGENEECARRYAKRGAARDRRLAAEHARRRRERESMLDPAGELEWGHA